MADIEQQMRASWYREQAERYGDAACRHVRAVTVPDRVSEWQAGLAYNSARLAAHFAALSADVERQVGSD